MRKIIYLVCLTCLASVSQGQLLQVKPFALAAPVEPDFHQQMVHTVKNEFIAVAKTKGSENSPATYALTKYDDQLSQKWLTSISLNKYENIIKMQHDEETIRLFITEHNNDDHYARLIVWSYDEASGKSVQKDTLVDAKINEWVDDPTKGRVKQDFNSALCSKQSKGFVTPLEYRFNVTYSPDGQKMMVYRYDYSQKNLLAYISIFDHNLKLLSSGQVNIDRGYMSYGFVPNNRGDVFIYKVNKGGKIAMIQYSLDSKEAKYLEMQMTNTMRENLEIHVMSDDQVYLAKLNKKDGVLLGLSFTKFDFQKEEIERQKYHEFSPAFKAKIIAQQKEEKHIEVEEDWRNFQITHFLVSEDEEVTIIAEERAIESTEFAYDAAAVEDKKEWLTRMGTVKTGTVVIWTFDKDHNLEWETSIAKHQEVDLLDGINTISFVVDDQLNDHLRFAYATGKKAWALHEIHYLELNRHTGEIENKVLIPNEEKLVLARPYALWLDADESNFIFVGKKGVLGKKTFICEYKPKVN